MKKIIMLFVCLFSLFCVSSLTTNASENELLEYDVNTYFRGVWVTPKDSGNIGNIKPTADCGYHFLRCRSFFRSGFCGRFRGRITGRAVLHTGDPFFGLAGSIFLCHRNPPLCHKI